MAFMDGKPVLVTMYYACIDCLPAWLAGCLPACLPDCLSVCLSVCLAVCP